jgi:hypothetical protein
MKKKTLLFYLLVLGVAFYFFTNQSAGIDKTVKNNTLPAAVSAVAEKPLHLDIQSKKAGCQAINGLPDHSCTPGSVFPNATKEIICVSGYTKTVRNVPVGLKKQVYQEYGIFYPQPTGTYEADHLIALELGGNNDISNLWPEVAQPQPGFHEKDVVENYLHNQVCDGIISLALAQQEISTDWEAVYNSLSQDQIQKLKAEFPD